jgi:transcriptional regulator with PAS, ATPase and Fis domain
VSDPNDRTLSQERFFTKTGESGAPPEPQLFLLLECARPMAGASRVALDRLDAVHIGRGAKRTFERKDEGRARQLSVSVSDKLMSSRHVKLSKIHGQWIAEDAGSKNGTLLNGAPLTRAVLADRDVLELGQTLFMFRDAVQIADEDPAVLEASKLAPPLPQLATFSVPFRRELDAVAKAARSNVSIVISGESGTGKEVIARAVHDLSRRSGAFVAVNCGALPDTLVEAELFGAKKGAYSGALEDRTGLVRAADKGTLLLDEIGDLPPSSQVAFLRVLQQREVVAIGDTRPVKVDFRLLAATHRDLEALAESGEFRKDLYARISGITLALPPVRDRIEDLGILIPVLLERIAGEEASKLAFSPKAARALFAHKWPLNVREVEKCLEAAAALADDNTIELSHLPASVRGGSSERAVSSAREPAQRVDEPLSSEDVRIKEDLLAHLAQHRGNISAVSRAMGKARMQIHRWIRRFDIDLDQYR